MDEFNTCMALPRNQPKLTMIPKAVYSENREQGYVGVSILKNICKNLTHIYIQILVMISQISGSFREYQCICRYKMFRFCECRKKINLGVQYKYLGRIF